MLLEKRIPLGYIVRKVRKDALTVLAISLAVDWVIYNQRQFVPDVGVAIPAFLGTAISLILSFKLSQSYDRWWEARKIWGAIVNDSRSLVRQALSFGLTRQLVERIGRRQIAWCYCLGQSLRGLDWQVGTQGHLDAREATEVARHNNKSLALLQRHARDVAEAAEQGQLSDYRRVALDAMLTRLTDSMGKAERIRNTVFPKTYRIFLHAFIYIFITLLSVSIAEVTRTWQVVITTGIAIPFFLLEKTALHMQDPFSNRPTDTSMTAIARTIEINLLQLLGHEEVPEPLPADGFYLM